MANLSLAWSRRRIAAIGIGMIALLIVLPIIGAFYLDGQIVIHDAQPPQVVQSSHGKEKTFVQTTHYKFELIEHNLLKSCDGMEKRVGGITKFGLGLIIVDKRGRFYHVELGVDGPKCDKLGTQLSNGFAAYKELAERRADAGEQPVKLNHIRFIDLIQFHGVEQSSIIVSYNYWHANNACATVRLSTIPLVEFLRSRESEIADDAWRLLFETQPCLPLKTDSFPFRGHQSGGRLMQLTETELLLTVGDFAFDGVEGNPIHPQNFNSDYGKLLIVNAKTGAARHFAVGLRNPQGLTIDDQGRILTTEHGPKGGDELNHLVEGGNYGWPYVTYGTKAGSPWPLSPLQAGHDDFIAPVYSWVPSIGVSNLIQVNGTLPAWTGDLLVGSLNGSTLYRLHYREDRVIFAEPILIGQRLRDLVQLESGAILLWTDAAILIELAPSELEFPYIEFAAEIDPQFRDEFTATWRECLVCHVNARSISASDAVNLRGVIGRDIASLPLVNYSNALAGITGKWDENSLDAFLANPSEFAPGTNMAFEGIQNKRMREIIIKFLKSTSNM